jgi:pimeloyl-ACP methyl ester carboxylesterase
VEAYLFPDGQRTIDQHLALGVSLGGHSVWQLMFADPRVTAGVVIIGCPDYMSESASQPTLKSSESNGIADLLTDRARLSKLSTFSAQDAGASFLGSEDFPPSLVEACKKFDPKAIFFGNSPVPDARPSGATNEAARGILRDRLRGKKFLLCSGGDDKLVPYQRCSEPFIQWFKQAAGSWFKEENVSVDDRVYPGIGHAFSADMITDSVKFVMDAVMSADQGGSLGGSEEQRSKI